jgi:hypothetical protein
MSRLSISALVSTPRHRLDRTRFDRMTPVHRARSPVMGSALSKRGLIVAPPRHRATGGRERNARCEHQRRRLVSGEQAAPASRGRGPQRSDSLSRLLTCDRKPNGNRQIQLNRRGDVRYLQVGLSRQHPGNPRRGCGAPRRPLETPTFGLARPCWSVGKMPTRVR